MTRVGLIFTVALVGLVVAGARTPAAQSATGRRAPAQRPAAPLAGVPRASDGHLSLEGNWTNATITPFQRPSPTEPLVLSEAAAVADEINTQKGVDAREASTSPDREAPPVGGEQRKSPNAVLTHLERQWQLGAGPVGGYNAFWIDPGDRVLRVNGQPRSSILIDPPDGQVPAYTPMARARLAAAAAARAAQGSEFDHPELRPLAERCITSFGSNLGPPMLPNYFYNNNYTIVQTKDHVLILTEMVHDTRIVRIGGQHLPTSVRQWFGDSIGRWEGDTLVIETTNFRRDHGFRNSWEHLKVTERLSRKDATTLSYRFTVEDSTTFMAPFSGELEFKAMAPGEQVYEYACHEANYGLEGVLSGARAQEREAARKKP
jgi:hypothetical protein